MCFKDKPLVPVAPDVSTKVCKGCWYEIDRVQGFLEMSGQYIMDVDAATGEITPLPPSFSLSYGLSEALKGGTTEKPPEASSAKR